MDRILRDAGYKMAHLTSETKGTVLKSKGKQIHRFTPVRPGVGPFGAKMESEDIDDEEAVENDNEYEMYFYYQYDEDLADKLDEEADDSDAAEMFDFVYPIMSKAASFVVPVFHGINDMFGHLWSAAAHGFGGGIGTKRRRMEEEEESDNNEDGMDMIADDWYDAESGENWIMLSDAVNDEYISDLKADQFGLEQVITNIVSSSGKDIKRKCMNLFGQQICICQFLQIIGAPEAAADHLCFPSNTDTKQGTKSKTSTISTPPKPAKPVTASKKKVSPNTLRKRHGFEPLEATNFLNEHHGDIDDPERRRQEREREGSKRSPLYGPHRGKEALWRWHKDVDHQRGDYGYDSQSDEIADLMKYRMLQKEREMIISAANKIRRAVKENLPPHRPLWVPHYFWHWLHLAPHYHLHRHRHRVPWIASSARMVNGGEDMLYNAQMEMAEYLEYEGDETYDDIDAYDDATNPLENGDDLLEDSEFLAQRMKEFENGLLFIAVSVLFCVAISCFLWRSKWGSLVRRLNERRLERRRKLFEAKFARDSDSSSLNISDVSPVHERDDRV